MGTEERFITGGKVAEAHGDYGYMPGFNNTHSTEAASGALPIGRNSPQKPPLGLYAEQLSGTAFTAPRGSNRRAWLYRIRPSVLHNTGFTEIEAGHFRSAPCREESDLPAQQFRWNPVEMPAGNQTDFLAGLYTMTTCGDVYAQAGIAAHVYVANTSMERRYFQNADGDMLILPEQNALRLVTEFGIITVSPGYLAIIPRNIKFRVELVDGPARGYVCENYGIAFSLPERGPIGANSLANERDFLYPAAAYEDHDDECEIVLKSLGKLYSSKISHSPLDVVAWHGNYAPYKYDLQRFNTIGSISFDHPDPSIFTVLTSPSEIHGTANCDFVIFPERWLVMEDAFRPPWYHTNVMSEFMGLIYGEYDAKPGGFVPGGMSLHNAGLPHGPDGEAFEKATSKKLDPEKLTGTMAFMFETRFVQNPTAFASRSELIDQDYIKCWQGLTRHFEG